MNQRSITVEMPEPHSENQRRLMMCFRTPHLRELWIACGTKYGKSIGAAVALSTAALTRKSGNYRWVAPIYAQTKIGFNYCRKLMPPEPYVDVNRSGPSIRIPSLDTLMEFKSGKDPEALEGEAINGYILDEASKMYEQVYDSAKTTTTVTRGVITAISTPRGKNWFYKKCMEAKHEMEYCMRKGLPIEKVFMTAPSITNPAVSEIAIEEARKSMPDRLFRQYYLAEFMDDSTVFGAYQHLLYGEELPLFGARQRWTIDNCHERDVVIGVDWAKKNDYTVFTAIDYNAKPSPVCGISRFQGIAYTEAVLELVKFCKYFRSVTVIYHDKTGVGEAIDDILNTTSMPTQGFVFTQSSKSVLVNSLIIGFERKMLALPRWSCLLNELDMYEVTTTSLGNMTYSAPVGEHDDTISSLMLAYAASQQYSEKDLNVILLEDMKDEDFNLESPLKMWYDDISDGDY